MRIPSDLPQRPRRVPRGRPALILTVIVLVVVATSLRAIAGFWTDYLWFSNLGFGNVFTGILSAKIELAVFFMVVAFVAVLASLIVADRIGPRLAGGPQDEIAQRYRDAVGRHAGKVRLVVAAFFALVLGASQSGLWNAWILFNHAQKFGTKDPQFHRDIGFYVFRLPFYQSLVSWAFGLVLVTTFITAVFHYLNGGIKLQTPDPSQRVSPQVKAHLSLLLGLLALIKGVGYYLQQYGLVLSTRGKVKGALYTDVHAQLPAFRLLMFISLIAFVLLIANIQLRGWTLPALGVGLWFLVSITAGAIYPAVIQNYTVKPQENSKERPYIARNINATRIAMGVNNVNVQPFTADNTLTPQNLQDNAQTIRNIRLWDPDPTITPATFSQVQALRGYYNFSHVDVDRYSLAGEETQTEVSVRELDQNSLPGGKSWVNEHLQFTHGYGAVLAPTNAATSDGHPVFDISNIPPLTSSGAPSDTPTITQPRVYFGEQTANFSIVGTKQQELDYDSQNGGNPVTSSYSGRGGVSLSSVIRKAAFALRFNDFNILISGAIKPSSRILYNRNVADRVHKVAPFLQLDADPYAVIGPDGHILWVQDAYTTTDRYPYSQDFDSPGRLDQTSGLNTSFNYVRNSVKVTVDAYDGTVNLYTWNPPGQDGGQIDPILRAYESAFPNLFKPMSAIPPGLIPHLRYPEDLFRAQTTMWGRYHITDPNAFYQAGDAWDVAQDPGVGPASSTTIQQAIVGPNGRIVPLGAKRQDPFYLVTRLPGQSQESFLMLQPMVAAVASTSAQQNMTAFMVAKSDPSDYGQIDVFRMPGTNVPGPVQVTSIISGDVQVSQAISLLNTNGSKVLFGNVLTIPVDQSLLYVRPLYVSSQNQGQAGIPLLKKVIVVYNNQVAYGNTLQDALNQLFPGLAPLTQEQAPTSPSTPTTPTTPTGPSTGTPNPTVSSLLAQALQDFTAANADLAKSPPDFAGYETEIQAAQALIRQANSLASGSPPGGPPSTAVGGGGATSTTAAPATTTTAPTQSAMGARLPFTIG